MNGRNFAIMAILAAIVTIALKVAASILTDSVGLLSDALESGVNLLTATITLIALTISARPPDEDHRYGHYKAEYFSSGAQGALILIAALVILASAIYRFIFPVDLQAIDTGLVMASVAALINYLVARILLKASQRLDSVALEAEASHLMTDVWTTVGVLVGVILAYVTKLPFLDPIVALGVAAHIAFQGFRIMKNAALGLMDTALDSEEVAVIRLILERYAQGGIEYHALRTRRSGVQRFASVHIQVPGKWSVQQGHNLLEKIELEIIQAFPRISIMTHLEPVEDPLSWEDVDLDRTTY